MQSAHTFCFNFCQGRESISSGKHSGDFAVARRIVLGNLQQKLAVKVSICGEQLGIGFDGNAPDEPSAGFHAG
jgi:hypothetical protein